MLDHLNIGCGNVYHHDWVNIDIYPNNPEIISHNILNGLPFGNDQFSVVYLSHLLEHIPKGKTLYFLKECFRVLKPNGIIRIVVPDLENIVDEYKKYLLENIDHPNPISNANYEWILLEMYDQTVRNQNGGQMADYIAQPVIINYNYLYQRLGVNFDKIRAFYLANRNNKKNVDVGFKYFLIKTIIKFKKNRIMKIRHILRNFIMTKEERHFLELGSFRESGEIHYWMYDRYSLKKLLEESGFLSVEKKSAFESNISKWSDFELDVKKNVVYSPTSIFIEAIKSTIKS